ncbi:hypothetical protein ACFX2I_015328 [Malus domestica]
MREIGDTKARTNPNDVNGLDNFAVTSAYIQPSEEDSRLAILGISRLAHLCNEVKGINYRQNIRRLEVMLEKLKKEMVAYEAKCEHFAKRLADEATRVESLDLCLRVECHQTH